MGCGHYGHKGQGAWCYSLGAVGPNFPMKTEVIEVHVPRSPAGCILRMISEILPEKLRNDSVDDLGEKHRSSLVSLRGPGRLSLS